jgi:hypothetical protein
MDRDRQKVKPEATIAGIRLATLPDVAPGAIAFILSWLVSMLL